ncbi:MAG: hypothetical protein Q9180_006534, partial [Flavoplaca navasiana]
LLVGQMATSISSSLVTCRNSFNTLIREMQVSNKKRHEGLSITDWEDERGRLRMWAANIGAHHTGQSSLDFRLRDSSQIQQQIIRLLENLTCQLEDAGTVFTEDEDSDVDSINGSDSGNEEPQSEIQQLRSNVASLIRCLFEISILVRNPARHDVRIRFKDIDLSAYESVDLRHVKDKFPKADVAIASRLGHAITYRRQYLKYRERHAAKPRQGIDHDVERDGRSEIFSETIATDIKTRSLDDAVDDNASDSVATQTSYASTLISGSGITIPAAPKASRGAAPFECPYCYCIVTAPNSRSWIQHVFEDLEPYVCIDMDCKTPNRLYTTRYMWLHHMKTAHRHHENETHECALCGDHQRDQASLGCHVARHLQELALFVLPRNEDDSDEEVSDGKANTSSNPSSLDYGHDLSLAIAPNDDAAAVEHSEYQTVNEAKSWLENTDESNDTLPEDDGVAEDKCDICSQSFVNPDDYSVHMREHMSPDRHSSHILMSKAKKYLHKGQDHSQEENQPERGNTAAAASPGVGDTREIRHHSQTGEEEEENESEDDKKKSVKDEEKSEEADRIPFEMRSKEDQAEEDSTNATLQVKLPKRGRTETLKVAIADQKDSGADAASQSVVIGGRGVWFCGRCHDGPHSITLFPACTNCGRPRGG